jgi:cytochrome b561
MTIKPSLPATLTPWPLVLRVVHWCTLLTVIAATTLALARDWVSDDDLTDALLGWHRYAGLAVLALTLARLVMRPLVKAPVHALSPLLEKVAAATHLLMYAFLIGMPVLGWLTSNAHGVTLTLGPITLPNLVAKDHDLGDTLGEFHEWGAWAFLSLIGLHALAALWHHFALKDSVLSSMLGRPRKPH